MSDSVLNFYQQKTDDELLFFVQHPHQYEPSLVEATRRELQRRGVALPPAVATTYIAADPTPASSLGKMVALGGLLVALGGGTYWLKQRNDTQVAAVKARAEARRRQPAPQLVEVATSAIPNYDGAVARAVAQQLSRIPASEKANAQHLRQFKELAKRFWAAQTQSEYLIDQANAGKATPQFTDQALVVRQTWSSWNHAAVYTYTFGPVMAEQYERMGKAASNQQHILDSLPALLPDRQFETDKEMVSRTAEVQDLMGSLVPISPVSGRAYQRTILKM